MEEKMKIKNVELKNQIVLAPMAGYTNLSYRKIMKEKGVGLVYSEMISAKGLVYENEKTFELTKVDPNEHPISMQIFGGDIESLVLAAKIIDKETDADIIDINMGCPVKKVLKANAGSSLLKDPGFIYEMVNAVVCNVSKPVSVKIRAGIDHSSINADKVAKAIEKAGASLIAVHGRTKSDLYRGNVNLDYIKLVKDSVSIPVIDIKSISDAERMFKYTNVDMIMVGRGSFGNPWLIRDLVDYFSGKPLQNPPTSLERVTMCERHFRYLLDEKIERIAVLEMRSLASWYLKGFSNAKYYKNKLNTITTKEELFTLLNEVREGIKYENEINESN